MSNTIKLKPLVGQRITAVRSMTPKELRKNGWDVDNCGMAPVVIETEEGMKVFASCDSEGNGYGCMFGETEKGKGFYVTPEGEGE